MTRVALALVVVLSACMKKKHADEPPREEPPTSRTVAVPPIAIDASLPPPTTPGQCDPKRGHTCYGDAVVECNGDGSYGSPIQTCKDGCQGGACVDTCATQGAELIYVVDEARELLSFDPQQLPDHEPFHLVGKLACPNTSSHPFSMSVARNGVAWVLYNDGQLFRVSIVDAHCAPVGLTGDGPRLFGMGFAHEGAGSDAETLFAVNNGPRNFGTIDITAPTPTWHARGTAVGDDDPKRNAPDLTGTRDGEVFGYFPETGGPSVIQQLDPHSGAPTGQRFSVPTHGSEANAWAFAHWGGVFYVFATFDQRPGVYAVRRKTGEASVVRERIPYHITGAGVSTCAPELEAQ